jgi:hypothetical protein
MMELCLSGCLTCGRGPAHGVNVQSYNDRQRGIGGEILGLTRVAVSQRLVGFPDDLPSSAGEQKWFWSI